MITAIIESISQKLVSLKSKDVEIINLENTPSPFNKAILATSCSSKHAVNLADHVISLLKKDYGIFAKSEGYASSEWILIDTGDIIINIFQHDTRVKYDLSTVWREQ